MTLIRSITFKGRKFSAFRGKHQKRMCQSITVGGKTYKTDDWTNLTETILKKIPQKLYLKENHPLSLLRLKIKQFYSDFFEPRSKDIKVFEELPEIVSTYDNFDSLLVPETHPSRSPQDNYYINSSTLMRAHTTCHYADLFKNGIKQFMIFGDVYRRDQIDRCHYPVFHQMDFVELFKNTLDSPKNESFIVDSLQNNFESLIKYLLGDRVKIRWVEGFFPFTNPSFEMEISFLGDNPQEWMEILGCGVIRQEILDRCILGIN
ncbi:Phenylalanine--tRNA ligase, mitochondrial [Thelohanellus kitauei]|uniref:Phenylalanine--tRNA ligase, mitochondrial n=1 Tax=Thelohanellus kitauei TaxID=669202 RepID=A0A0C2N1G2_THEKT|nr:Phenylalanine--tRNA ligase, mitochondrial [Thelohanellus kitauei]